MGSVYYTPPLILKDSLGLLHHSSKVPIQSSDTPRTPQGLLKEFINYRSKTLEGVLKESSRSLQGLLIS